MNAMNWLKDFPFRIIMKLNCLKDVSSCLNENLQLFHGLYLG